MNGGGQVSLVVLIQTLLGDITLGATLGYTHTLDMRAMQRFWIRPLATLLCLKLSEPATYRPVAHISGRHRRRGHLLIPE